MIVSPGSAEASALTEILRSVGLLVDVYSAEFFARQPRAGDPQHPDAPFYSDGFDEVNFLESDKDGAGIFPKGHLLVVWLDRHAENFDDIRRRFVEVYPPLSAELKRRRVPNFLIFNLFVRQILAVGLDVGNRLRIVDISTGEEVKSDSAFLHRFAEHDVYNAAEDLLKAMESLEKGLRLFHRLPGNPEFVKLGITKGPNQNGDYFIVDYAGDPVDEQAFSLEELEEIASDFEIALGDLDFAGQVINAFFPLCDVWDLDAH